MNIEHFSALGADVKCYIREDYPTQTEHKFRPAIVICAGGAYRWKSPREKDAPVLEFLSEGYNVFLIDYSVGEHAKDYQPLRELGECVKIIRERSEELFVDPARIAVLGFSAGGHLAASLGAKWNDEAVGLGEKSRPDALVLCYPVLSTGEFRHAESIEWVTGGDESMRSALDIPNNVTADFPPTFIWHAREDESVPVENTLLLVTELQKQKIPYECHIFDGGKHGISTCTVDVQTTYPAIAPWVGLCKTWLDNQFKFEK